MAKETVKFDQIKDFAWLNDAAKEKDAKALKSAYRKQAAKTGFARFFINFLPIIFFGPLFHMAYWFVNAIVVAYKKGQEQSAEIAADPDAKANQHKAAFYWDWSRVFDGINEKVIQLRTVKKYIVDSAETDPEDSVESVNVVDSDQDDESTSQDDKASKKSSSSTTTEVEAAKSTESKPKQKRDSVAEPKKPEAKASSAGEEEPKKKKVKADATAKNEEKPKKKEVRATAKGSDKTKDKKEEKADVNAEEERQRKEAEAKVEEERQRKEAEANAKAEEERQRKEAEENAKVEEERQRKEAEANAKAEEERRQKEAEENAKAEEERKPKEAEQKPAQQSWWGSLWGSEPAKPTGEVKEDTNVATGAKQPSDELEKGSVSKPGQEPASPQELGVGGEVIESALESPKKVVKLEEAGDVAVEEPVKTAKPAETAEVKPDAKQSVIASFYSWWNKPKQPAQPPLPPAQHEVRTPNNTYNTIDADLGGRDPNAEEHVVTEQPQAHVEINLEDLGDELVDHDLMGSVEHIPVDPNANTATIV